MNDADFSLSLNNICTSTLQSHNGCPLSQLISRSMNCLGEYLDYQLAFDFTFSLNDFCKLTEAHNKHRIRSVFQAYEVLLPEELNCTLSQCHIFTLFYLWTCCSQSQCKILLIIIHLKRGNQLSANETQLDWDHYQESLQEGTRTVLQCSS